MVATPTFARVLAVCLGISLRCSTDCQAYRHRRANPGLGQLTVWAGYAKDGYQ